MAQASEGLPALTPEISPLPPGFGAGTCDQLEPSQWISHGMYEPLLFRTPIPIQALAAEARPFDVHADLRQVVEANIISRTWGRIHRLEVEATEDRVVVRGCAPSYYVKQLAIQAVLESLSVSDAPLVEVEIDVIAAELPRPAMPRSAPPRLPR